MKKLFVAGVAVFIMAIGFLAMAAAEEFTITGYGPREFAVKGEIEQQAEKMIKGWGNRKPANIIIQGFADKTGKAAENDAYARDRAREMKAFLETKTDAKVTALSKGDSEDERKVVVTVKFTVTLPSASWPVAQVSILKVALVLSVIVFFIFLLNILVDRLSRKRKQASILKAEEIEAKKESPKPPAEPTTEWVEVDGYSIRIEIDYVDGEKRCYSPFASASGLKIYEPSESRMIGSIRRCLKPDSKFSEQVKSLKEAGLIRPLQ